MYTWGDFSRKSRSHHFLSSVPLFLYAFIVMLTWMNWNKLLLFFVCSIWWNNEFTLQYTWGFH